MKIIQLKINELSPYKSNPRKNKNAINDVAESIKQFGFKQPIVIDKNNKIVCGHTRFLAAKKLKLKSVPCVIADDLTDEQIKKYRIVDNATAEKSEWDLELLSAELEDINLDEFDFNFNLENFEIDSINKEQDDIPEEPKEPQSKLGDIWRCGEHRVFCGSSESIPFTTNFDLVLADPPYNYAYEGKTKEKLKIQNDAFHSKESYIAFLLQTLSTVFERLKVGGSFYVWHGALTDIEVKTSINNLGIKIRQVLIWVKNSLVMGRQDYQIRHESCLYGWRDGASHNWYSDRKQTTVLEFDRPFKNKEHPTMKPLSLFMYLVENSSKTGDFVVDPFLGSGTTLIACERLNRVCYGCEIEPTYVDVILQRYFNETGDEPVCESRNARFVPNDPTI